MSSTPFLCANQTGTHLCIGIDKSQIFKPSQSSPCGKRRDPAAPAATCKEETLLSGSFYLFECYWEITTD